ncbi:UbiA family prenyltransferase [Microvirga aerophila]|uniref:Prenyltransferase n=1 Tax=Microvirga aerophila TaxID=670291 RepID=A0A512BWK9_9HYPH|nr:UbiA family prenyltransferase [Microvirga aerophila]GEO16336.1 prenyltransferase [Microvirga aerophila]
MGHLVVGYGTLARASTVKLDIDPSNTTAVSAVPLIVDLDRALVQSDLLYELLFEAVSVGLKHNLQVARQIWTGRAALKQYLASDCHLDYGSLPYDEQVLKLIRDAKARGQDIYLATACDEHHAKAIAEHLGCFDGYFVSIDRRTLSDPHEGDALVQAFGRNGFDYIGHDAADLAIWSRARQAYAVRASSSVLRKLASIRPGFKTLDHNSVSWRTWAKALRVHQYAKNLLVFVPLVTAHEFAAASLLMAGLAFMAFSACASAVYILNDLIDLRADRAHPTKRHRPFARGQIPLATGLKVVPGLLLVSGGLASLVSVEFTAVLMAYFSLTTAYSLYLKRKIMIDVVVLAMLYTVRVVAGAVSIEVQVSEWLFAFALLMFTSLALIKRYVELSTRLDQGLPNPLNRDYKIGDLNIVAALAAAAGMNAITVLALYVSSPKVASLYTHPALLWLLCPVLVYWLGRALLLAHRRLMDDDPIVFAIRDRNSWAAAAISAACIVAAM